MDTDAFYLSEHSRGNESLMNANIHTLSKTWVTGLGMICLLAYGTSFAAEPTRNNPLRPGGTRIVATDENVQPATAHASVTRSVHRNSPPMNGVRHGMTAVRHEPRGFVPRHELVANVQVVDESSETLLPPLPAEEVYSEEVYSDEVLMDDLPGEGEYLGDPGFGGKGMDSCGDCGGCGYCSDCLIPCPVFTFNYFEFFGGAQGFTGPTNRGETGSFGFHYGVNWAAPVPCMPNRALGMQIGYRGVNSNYSGASFTDDTRNQSFITAGLFRRVDWGLQGGVVVDYLRDEWYYDLSLTQIRGELSWVYPESHELGFWFASSSKSDTVVSTLLVNGQQTMLNEEYEATDLYAFFYRHRFERLGGGNLRFYGGFTGKSDGLLGADFKVPLTPDWALQGGFTYLAPKDGNQRIAHSDEAWNVGVSLIWYPGGRKSIGNDYFRPLFDVADNGSFMVKQFGD
jgi:hypothetical protein